MPLTLASDIEVNPDTRYLRGAQIVSRRDPGLPGPPAAPANSRSCRAVRVWPPQSPHRLDRDCRRGAGCNRADGVSRQLTEEAATHGLRTVRRREQPDAKLDEKCGVRQAEKPPPHAQVNNDLGANYRAMSHKINNSGLCAH